MAIFTLLFVLCIVAFIVFAYECFPILALIAMICGGVCFTQIAPAFGLTPSTCGTALVVMIVLGVAFFFMTLDMD